MLENDDGGGEKSVQSNDEILRKENQEALRVSEERYRHLLQYAPIPIYEIDFTGPKFRNVNDAVCEMAGRSSD